MQRKVKIVCLYLYRSLNIKSVHLRKTNYLLAAFIGCFSLFTLSSCLKGGSITTTPPPALTYISLMDLAIQAPPADVFFSGTKANSSQITPGTWTASYSAITPAVFDVTFKKYNVDSVMATIPAVSYDSAKFYTLVLYNDQSTSAKAFRTIDDFSGVTFDKPYIRFFHLSQNTGAVDFYMNAIKISSNRTLADNINNPADNLFTASTNGIYTIQAKLAGTDSVVATANLQSILSGDAYTIFLQGLSQGTGGNALGIGVLQAVSN
jgi:hypothetical protein